MLLVANVGNTHTVLGLLDDGEVVAHWRVTTAPGRTADEWGVLLTGLMGGAGLGPPTGVAVCATVPSAMHEWRTLAARVFADLPVVFVGPGTRTGIPVLTDNPREVGVDRVVNALAAARLYRSPAVVVDLGTATTFDAVDRDGHYIGGAIAPGIELSLTALGSSGAQLRQVELVKPHTVIAKNTVAALQSGMVFGAASLVDGMVARMIAEMGAGGADPAVIATGYLAHLVVGECTCFTDHSPWLTLQGLGLVFARNASPSRQNPR